MVFAARFERIPCALTEADAHLGLANRLAAPLANLVFLALPLGLHGEKYRAVGRPIPAASRPIDREEARSRLDLPADAPVVLVFGGSLGARLLNDLALDAWAEEGPAVIHLCGERDYPELEGRVTRPDYILQPFIDEIGVAYGAADVVLARAGGSVWELAAAGLPALLVPGEFATGQHQEKNARWFADAGGAVVVPEAEAARAPRVVEELLEDPDRLAAMATAMRAVAKPHAAEEIADELVSLAAARR
jgi:UDP-N-acetylglucosamine--N-acetylmuramyl-(pentapeptide) pyrophosphoryl-undecaprenol N-acetylglucosamine transferase